MSKKHSKKYKQNKKAIGQKEYSIDEAIKLAKDKNLAKFGGSIELKVNVNIDPKDSEQNIRFLTTLPHYTMDKKKVLVFGEFKNEKFKNVEPIKGDEKTVDNILSNKVQHKKDFDLIITSPAFMPKIAKAARVLGPKGLMPNPKTNTVGDVNSILKELDKGQVEVRSQPSNKVIHLVLGNTKTSDKDLAENYNKLLNEIIKHKPPKVKKGYLQSVFVSATMSPSVRVSVANV